MISQHETASKPQLFCQAIYQLSSGFLSPDVGVIKKRLIKAFENHEQDLKKLVEDISSLSTQLKSTGEQALVSRIINSLESYVDTIKIDDQFLNPFARRYESEFAVEFSLNPTSAMMAAVNQVSEKFVYLLQNNSPDYFASAFSHISGIGDRALLDGFGFFKKVVSAEDIIDVLKRNDKKDLLTILMVQNELIRDLKREKQAHKVNLPPWKNSPSDSLVKYISGRLPKNSTISYPEFIKTNTEANELSKYIDGYIYSHPYYSDRGRLFTDQQIIESKLTPRCALGLMLPQQKHEDLAELAINKGLVPWKADIIFQKANLNSKFVMNLLSNDCIYISGVSGLTCMFLGAMELLGNLASDQARYNYFLAFATYLMSGGLHSLCEVLMPTAATVKIIPNYQDHNYQTFYDLFKEDPEFVERYEKVWKNFTSGFLKENFEVEYKSNSNTNIKLFDQILQPPSSTNNKLGPKP